MLIVPNIDGVESILNRVKAEIEREINQTFFSQFSFLMTWENIQKFMERFKVYNFYKLADHMFHLLESEKSRKAHTVLIDADTKEWNRAAFKADTMYSQYLGKGDCKICGRGPGICEEKDPDSGEIVMSCAICWRDKYILGGKVPKVKTIAFGKGELSEAEKSDKIIIFDSKSNADPTRQESYFVDLNSSFTANSKYYLQYDIGHLPEGSRHSQVSSSLKRYIANHVPTNNSGEILSFEELAQKNIRKKGEKEVGSQLLGVLKADIDNLGLIFSRGFDSPKPDEAKYPETDRKTTSRFLTLSRMIDLFFSGWIKTIMEKNDKEVVATTLCEAMKIEEIELLNIYLREGNVTDFENIYTVYSGGDDTVLVGPWETMIVFSIFLNMQFRKFTCNNKDITLSAGLAFVKPKHPIANAIKEAETLLERSKKGRIENNVKNRITLFNTTVEWELLPKLTSFFLFLNEKLDLEDTESKINAGFIYRLGEYHKNALDFFNDQRIDGLRYISQLNYDIGRMSGPT